MYNLFKDSAMDQDFDNSEVETEELTPQQKAANTRAANKAKK